MAANKYGFAVNRGPVIGDLLYNDNLDILLFFYRRGVGPNS